MHPIFSALLILTFKFSYIRSNLATNCTIRSSPDHSTRSSSPMTQKWKMLSRARSTIFRTSDTFQTFLPLWVDLIRFDSCVQKARRFRRSKSCYFSSIDFLYCMFTVRLDHTLPCYEVNFTGRFAHAFFQLTPCVSLSSMSSIGYSYSMFAGITVTRSRCTLTVLLCSPTHWNSNKYR